MYDVMIDAGHYGYYNRSPANKSYYESIMSWELQNLLKNELETYGITVGTTRTNQATDMEVYTRGTKAKNCKMFISLHSNAVGSNRNDNIDYPVIYMLASTDEKGEKLADTLVTNIARVMGTKQGGRVATRLQNNGAEYYGVLRGAKAVGCRYAYIIEHSFHTAYAPTTWLLDNANLKKLAVMEASHIAAFFSATKEMENNAMRNPYEGGKFKVTSIYGNRVLNGVSQFHSGLDIVGLSSKYLIAVCDGVIEQSTIITNKSDLTWQWGNFIKLRANTGEIIFYCHLSKRLVSVGQRVKKGDVIGIEGNTGYSFGSHCHLEVRSPSNKVTATYNTPSYTGIPNKVQSVTVTSESEEIDMTKAELEALINEKVTAAQKKIEAACDEKITKSKEKVYHYWEDLPEWAEKPLMALYKKSYFVGESPSDLNLSYSCMRTLVTLARALKADGKLNY